MKRILIIKMWAIGDILLATPLLRALKRQYPDCAITWLADKSNADILRGNPLLDEVIAFDSRTWRRYFRYGQWLSYVRVSMKLRRELSAHQFDVVINLTPDKWWTVWFLPAPIRIGLFPSKKIGRLKRYYTTSIPYNERDSHNIRRSLSCAEALGIPGPFDEKMVVGTPGDSRRRSEEFLANHPGYRSGLPLIVLHPGASQRSKCWLPENFAALAAQLSERYNIVITGSPSERALAERIQGMLPPGTPPPLIAAGELPDILDTAALAEQAVAVVTGDTSVLHIASALETPLVGLFGSTRPGNNKPIVGPNILLFDDSVPCAPCYKAECPLQGADFMRCHRAVTAKHVLDAVELLTKKYARNVEMVER